MNPGDFPTCLCEEEEEEEALASAAPLFSVASNSLPVVEGGNRPATSNASSPSDRVRQGRRLLCPGCLRRGLRDAWDRRQRAVELHAGAERECGGRIAELSGRRLALAALQDESARLAERVLELRGRAGDIALEAARGAVEIEALQRELRGAAAAAAEIAAGEGLRRRDRLARLERCVLADGLERGVRDAGAQSRALRFAWALQAFRLHRLDVAPADPADRVQLRSGRMKHARGIGKIGGLPLPHAGPELFGVLPPPELESALRLVASLTWLAARCLNVALPHPIRLRHDDAPDSLDPLRQDILSAVRRPPPRPAAPSAPPSEPSAPSRSEGIFGGRTIENISELMSSSTASLASLLRGGASKWGGAAPPPAPAPLAALPTLSEEASFVSAAGPLPSSIIAAPLITDPATVRRRVDNSRAAAIAEDWGSETSSWYRLSVGGSDSAAAAAAAAAEEEARQDEFVSALQLLQDDLIALCIRSGVPVDRLWPAEALLLNLDELHRHCREQVAGGGGSPAP